MIGNKRDWFAYLSSQSSNALYKMILHEENHAGYCNYYIFSLTRFVYSTRDQFCLEQIKPPATQPDSFMTSPVRAILPR